MAAALKELDDVTECAICTEVFTDPRVLPCVHTYCLKCILSWAKDKKPGDQLACPLCRKDSIIPGDGLGGLPRNFFIEKMLCIKELSRVGSQPTPCDMCTYKAQSGATPINSATTYCVQCQENYCQPCASIHQKPRGSRHHKQLQIGGKMKPEDLLAQYPPANCDKHVDKALEIFCNDCKQVICMLCYIKEHNTHKCSDINEVADSFLEEMTCDVTSMVDGVEQCKQTLQMLTKEKKDFSVQVSTTEREIHQKTKQLRQMIDRHEESLLNELKSVQQKRTKKVDTAYEEVERRQASMESCVKYVSEIREKGTACDIVRAASGLRERAGELLMFGAIERTLDDLGHADVTFTSSKFVVDESTKTIGQLWMNVSKSNIGERLYPSPRLMHVQPGDTAVYAVTSLGDRIYAVRYDTKKVEVYDFETMALQRRIPVPPLTQWATGIAACPVYKRLYLSDRSDSSPAIIRVDLSTGAAKKWSVAQGPRGLSITSDHNVLVACHEANKLQEYTTDGRLVREICLQSDMKYPWHAIQLSTGQYVVSQCKSRGVVSVVGVDGRVVRSYGQSPSSDVGQIKWPRSLSVAKHGDVFVADQDNDRILAINSSFTRAQTLSLSADVGLRGPFGLFLDESRDRLYIGEFGGSNRVIALDNVRSIRWK